MDSLLREFLRMRLGPFGRYAIFGFGAAAAGILMWPADTSFEIAPQPGCSIVAVYANGKKLETKAGFLQAMRRSMLVELPNRGAVTLKVELSNPQMTMSQSMPIDASHRSLMVDCAKKELRLRIAHFSPAQRMQSAIADVQNQIEKAMGKEMKL